MAEEQENIQSSLDKAAIENLRYTVEQTREARNLSAELRDQLGMSRAKTEAEKSQLSITRQLNESAMLNNDILGDTLALDRQILKDKANLNKILTEQGVLTQNMSEAEIDAAKRIVDMTSRIVELENELVDASDEEAELIQTRLQRTEKMLSATLKLQSVDVKRLALMQGLEQAQEKQLKQRLIESQRQQDINDKMGVAGAVATGLGGIMERLGMRSGIFKDAMTDAQKTMRQMAKDTVDGKENFSKLGIAAKGFGIIAKGFAKALTDPATIAKQIFDTFLEINKTSAETSRLVGQSGVTFDNTLNSSVASLNDSLKLANELTKELGMSAFAIFPPSTLANMAEAVNLLGLSTEQAGNLGLRSQLIGQSTSEFNNNILRGADAMNSFAGSAIAPGVVLKDVLSVSEDIAMSLGNNPEALGAAAVAARNLGMELKNVDKIADGLLNFEDSITKELEAQLMTGKNINLAKARQAALDNDLTTVAKELAANGASAAEFAEMSRLEQQALAEALGMSRQELGKMILTQETQNNLTDKQRASVLGMTEADLQRMDFQTKINKLVEKFASLLSPVLDSIIAIVDNSYTLYTLMGALAISRIPILVSGFATFAKSIKATLGFTRALLKTRNLELAQRVRSLILGKREIAQEAVKNSTKAAGMTTMAAGITSLGAAATAVAPGLLAIAAIVAAVGVAAAGIGFGFKMASDGVVNLMNNLTMEKLGPLYLLGPALFSIAAGLAAISATGTAAIPTLLALSAFSLAVTPLASLFAGGEGAAGEGSSMAAVEEKLDNILGAIQQGGNVYLDGTKVGETLALGNYSS